VTYTRPWSTYSPNGKRAGGQFDDAQRELRVDLDERLSPIVTSVGGDWTADPVASVLTRYRYLHWSDFKLFSNMANNTFGQNVYATASGQFTNTLVNQGIGFIDGGVLVAVTMHATVALPAGATLVDVDISCVVGAASEQIVGTVYVTDSTTPTVTRTQLATRTFGNPTTQNNYSLSSGAGINHVLDRDLKEQLYLTVAVTTDQAINALTGFQGVRVSYTREALGYA
jgi:hypothetical protein